MTNYYVANNGNNSNEGSLLSPFLTINKGIDIATDGDTIFIRGGEYNESMSLTKGKENKNYLIVKAYNGETPVIIPRIISSGWASIGDNKWTITLSKNNYLFFVNDDLNTYSPSLIKKDDRGIVRVNSLEELTNTGLNTIVGESPSDVEYDLFFSEEDGDNINITLFLIENQNPNKNIIYIVDSTDVIEVSSQNIEINGLTIRYSYQGVSVIDNNPSMVDVQAYFYSRILNNIIERTAFHGINNLKDGVYIYNNTIKYCGARLKYSEKDPSYFLEINNLVNCIYSVGDNSEISGNTLEKSYGIELYCLDKDALDTTNISNRKPKYNIIKNNFVKGQSIISGSYNSIYNNIFVNDTDSATDDCIFDLYAPYNAYIYNNIFIGYKGIKIRTDDQSTEYLELVNNVVKILNSNNLILELLGDSFNYKISNNIYYGSNNFYINELNFTNYSEYIDYMGDRNLELGSINENPNFSNSNTNPDNYSDLGFYPADSSFQIDNGVLSNKISKRQLELLIDSSSQELWVDYTNGDDNNSGSENSPLQTFDYALTQISSGVSENGRSVLYIKSGTHTINPSTISYKNYVDIVFEENVIFNDGSGAGHDSAFSSSNKFFEIKNCNYIRVIGNLAVFNMTYEYYEAMGSNPQTHAIAIHGSDNIIIQSIRVAESGADGLYVGVSAERSYSSNIEIYDFVVEKSRRNCVSVVSADRLIGNRWFLKNANGESPRAGIDFESNIYPNTQRLANININNVWIENCTSKGIHFRIPQGSIDPDNPSVIMPDVNIVLINFYIDGSSYEDFIGISIGTIYGTGERADWKAIIEKGINNNNGKYWFRIEDDYSEEVTLGEGRFIEVHGSQNNNGLYKVESVSYDIGENITTINIGGEINDMNPSIVDGYLEIRITEEFTNEVNIILDKFTVENCGDYGFGGTLFAENKNIVLKNSKIKNAQISDIEKAPIFFDAWLTGGGAYGDVTIENVYIEDEQDRSTCSFDWQGTVYKYAVESIDFSNNKFIIGSDLTSVNIFDIPPIFTSVNEPGNVIRIYGSTNKDGIYTISNSEVSNGETIFTVLDNIPEDESPADSYGNLYFGPQPLVNCHGNLYVKNSILDSSTSVINFGQESKNFDVDIEGERTDIIPNFIGFYGYEVHENNFLTNISNPYLSSSLDYSGGERVLDGGSGEIVDIGPFEYQQSPSLYTDINNGEIVNVSENIYFRFISVDSNTATIVIDGINFIIKNENGLFVWDNNSKINKNIFTWANQKIYRKAGKFYIRIIYIGEGSLLFSIEFIMFYKMVADLINESQDRGSDISSKILQMRNDLDNSEIDDENIDKLWLYNEIDRTYAETNTQHNNYSSEILNFVQKLQKYITDKYDSVSSFLRENNLTVLPTFAEISNLVGYPIDNDLIISEEDLCPIS